MTKANTKNLLDRIPLPLRIPTLTVQEAADVLEVSHMSVHRYIRHHNLPSVRVANRIRIPLRSLLEWAESR